MQETAEKEAVAAGGGAESGAPVAGRVLDPDLKAVVAAWPALPPAIKAGITAMVTASRR
jgi:hypothetical protein